MPIRVDQTVADTDALSRLHVSKLEDGCLVYVQSGGAPSPGTPAYYALKKNPTGSQGPFIVLPISGSPIAGCPNAIWKRALGV